MRGRRILEFPTIPETQRRNPQIIRQLIYEIVRRDFNLSFESAANTLELHKSKKIRKGVSITGDVLYNLVMDRTLVRYYHIEAIANYFDVPVFIILAITRIASDARDNNIKSLSAIKSYLSQLADISDLNSVSVGYLFDLKERSQSPRLF